MTLQKLQITDGKMLPVESLKLTEQKEKRESMVQNACFPVLGVLKLIC